MVQPISGLRVFAQFGFVALWGLLLLSVLAFFPVWGVRRLLGRVPPGAAVRIRAWPLLAALCVAAFLALFMAGFLDPFRLLGGPTTVSVGILLATLGFALFTLLGLQCAWGARRLPINRGAYWHSTAASLFNAVALAYFALNGVIGLVTWS